MLNKTRPSIVRIVQSDYLSMLGVLIPIVSLIMYAAIVFNGYLPALRGHDPINGAHGALFFFYLSILGVVVGLPLAFWRIRTVQILFSKSMEVNGQITNIAFIRDRGRVDYSYIYQSKNYTGGIAIMKTSQTQKLRVGNQVVILVDPDNPKGSLIRDLYV